MLNNQPISHVISPQQANLSLLLPRAVSPSGRQEAYTTDLQRDGMRRGEGLEQGFCNL